MQNMRDWHLELFESNFGNEILNKEGRNITPSGTLHIEKVQIKAKSGSPYPFGLMYARTYKKVHLYTRTPIMVVPP